MKVEQITLEHRISIPFNRQKGIYHYGTGNVYPQTIEALVKSSSTGKSIAETASKFIRGKGFVNGGDTIIDREGTNLNELLRMIGKDISYHYAFALIVHYNLLGEVAGFQYVPASWVRLGRKDDKDYIGKAVIYDNWGKQKSKTINPKDFKIIDTYNPRKDVVLAQIKRDGGIENYKGQLFFFSFDNEIR